MWNYQWIVQKISSNDCCYFHVNLQHNTEGCHNHPVANRAKWEDSALVSIISPLLAGNRLSTGNWVTETRWRLDKSQSKLKSKKAFCHHSTVTMCFWNKGSLLSGYNCLTTSRSSLCKKYQSLMFVLAWLSFTDTYRTFMAGSGQLSLHMHGNIGIKSKSADTYTLSIVSFCPRTRTFPPITTDWRQIGGWAAGTAGASDSFISGSRADTAGMLIRGGEESGHRCRLWCDNRKAPRHKNIKPSGNEFARWFSRPLVTHKRLSEGRNFG